MAEDVLQRHFNSSKDLRSLHLLLVGLVLLVPLLSDRLSALVFVFPDVVSEPRLCGQTRRQTCRPAGGQQAVLRRR